LVSSEVLPHELGGPSRDRLTAVVGGHCSEYVEAVAPPLYLEDHYSPRCRDFDVPVHQKSPKRPPPNGTSKL
jgi:hypothetical protein